MSPTEITRNTALKIISRSASYGNLGLFIGAGFSKAILNEGSNRIALSWTELLQEVSKQLKIDYNAIPKEGVSYPEIASRICQEYTKTHNETFAQALSKVKRAIADLTCWYPDQEKRNKFGTYLDEFAPAWVITTNYDLVIESLLTGRSIPLGPNDQLTNPRGVVPVYHLHGVRTNPEEIVIAQEDYISLFRPNEYRQIKLALTIKESTTLLLGYGLGDVNVLTALDWSKNVFGSAKIDYPHDVVQVVRKENPKNEPYRDKNRILIIETNELTDFFDEYAEVRKSELQLEDDNNKKLRSVAERMANPEQQSVELFIDDQNFRKRLLTTLSKSPIHLISGFISFLDKCIDETWRRSEPNGAFEGYNQNLSIILDILTEFNNVSNMPPALFQATAYALYRVTHYIGYGPGESWSSAKTWDARKGELSEEMVKELRNISEQYRYKRLYDFLTTCK